MLPELPEHCTIPSPCRNLLSHGGYEHTHSRLGVGVAETVRTTVSVIAEILLRNLRTVESVLRGCGLHLVLADPNHNAPLRIGFWIQIRQVFVTESYLTGGNAIYAPLQIRACIADICAAIPEFETTFIAMTRGAVLTIGAPPLACSKARTRLSCGLNSYGLHSTVPFRIRSTVSSPTV